MTCCVGIEDGTSVWLAGDSASTTEDSEQSLSVDPKVWERKGWGFAYAGSWRVGQLLRADFDPPSQPKNMADVERLMKKVLPAEFRAILRNENDADVATAELLVAVRGCLFEMHFETMYSLRSTCGYNAIGTYAAATALAVTENMDWTPKTRVLRVLKAVSATYSNVRPPFTVIRV